MAWVRIVHRQKVDLGLLEGIDEVVVSTQPIQFRHQKSRPRFSAPLDRLTQNRTV